MARQDEARGCAEVGVDFGEKDVQDKCCEKRAKGAILGQAVFLGEGAEGSVRLAVPADVGLCVKHFEERNDRPEFVVAL